MTTRKHRPVVKHDVNEQSAYELWCWGGPAKADEVVEWHRVRSAPNRNGQNIRRLAVAMIENALTDLRKGIPGWAPLVGKSYRPDPDSARAWLHRETDAPMSAVWCEQVTGISLDRLRRKYPLVQNRPVEAPRRPVAARRPPERARARRILVENSAPFGGG